MEENRNPSSEGQLFHTVFRGFSRADVVSYIERLTAQHRQEREDAALRIRALEEERDRLCAQLDAEKEAGKALAAQTEKVQAQRDSAQQALTQQGLNEQAHIEAASVLLRRESDEKDACIADLTARLETARQSALALQAESEMLAQRAQAGELAAKYFAAEADALRVKLNDAHAQLEAQKTQAPAETAAEAVRETVQEVRRAAEKEKENAEKRVQEAKSTLSSLLSRLKNE